MRGFTRDSLQEIEKYLYSDEVRTMLAYTYGPPSTLPADMQFPDTVIAGSNMVREIFMGCNARSLALALPGSTYMYDSAHVPDSGILGLYEDFGRDADVVSAPNWRDRFLNFIHMGTPDPHGEWPTYGNGSNVRVAGVPSIHGDIFDNRRCDWWTNVGYEKFFKESDAARAASQGE